MEQWFIKNKKADFKMIAQQFGISEILARLVVNRNISSNEQLKEYINPSLEYMYNPRDMKDMETACNILCEKIKEKKQIRIIGDYDVDGVMSTYILLSALKKCGAVVDYEIPDRIKDGYGINMDIIKAADDDFVDTIITCDNGIAASEQIEYAKKLGMTVIITDHHDIPFVEEDNEKRYYVPKADAVVNPKQEDCSYPCKNLCGAVVAYKLAEVLFEKHSFNQGEVRQYLEYAAIATVCDVMDLIEENRIIVKHGLETIKATKNLGLQALIKENGLSDKTIGVYHLGFVIGPCINASGRLVTAKLGLELLMAKEAEEALRLAKQLKKLNDERKNMTAEGLAGAIDIIEKTELKADKVLVVYLPDCHESLAGIIAGRIKEKYNRPTIVLTKGEHLVKGSGRSIESYHMFDELTKCKDILSKFGGHPMAAGLSLEEEKVEELRKRLNDQTVLTEEDLTAKVSFDMVLPFSQISISLLREMCLLEPYGKGNLRPSFARKDVRIIKAVMIGANKNVLRLTVKEENRSYTAMLFHDVEKFETIITQKYGEEALKGLYSGVTDEILLDMIFYPDLNEYNGYQNIQIIVQNYR